MNGVLPVGNNTAIDGDASNGGKTMACDNARDVRNNVSCQDANWRGGVTPPPAFAPSVSPQNMSPACVKYTNCTNASSLPLAPSMSYTTIPGRNASVKEEGASWTHVSANDNVGNDKTRNNVVAHGVAQALQGVSSNALQISTPEHEQARALQMALRNRHQDDASALAAKVDELASTSWD